MSGPATTLDPSPEDLALVARARRGDLEAFSGLVARYQRALTARALSSTRRVQDADDMVQETFLRAFRGLPRFRDNARFGPWLFRILGNLLADRGRRSGRELTGVQEDAETPAGRDANPEHAVILGELRERLLAELDALPPGRQREVFELRYLKGLAIGEIAERLELHTGTVKVHLHRSTKRLRESLDGWETI